MTTDLGSSPSSRRKRQERSPCPGVPAKPLTRREAVVWDALRTIAEAAVDRVASLLEAQTGLSAPDFAILSELEAWRGSLIQRELQKALGWDKSRLSHQLTRMQARGLLRRATIDNRVIVKIRVAGGTAVAAARSIHASAVRELLGHMDERTQDAVVNLSTRLSELAN